MGKVLLILLGMISFLSLPTFAQTVRTKEEFAAAVNQARPGSTIRIAPGHYHDWGSFLLPAKVIVLPKRGALKVRRPIIIESENLNNPATFSGAIVFRVTGDSYIIRNLRFRDTHDTVFRIDGSNSWLARGNKLQNLDFRGYGRRQSKNGPLIFFGPYSIQNQLMNSSFRESSSLQTVQVKNIGFTNRLDSNGDLLDKRGVRIYDWGNEIAHNIFSDIYPTAGITNGREAIQLGQGPSAKDRRSLVKLVNLLRAKVHHNTFLRVAGEVETVSVKSFGNTITHNLFLDSHNGHLTLRAGGDTYVAANIFRNTPGGVRVFGINQGIYSNVIVHPLKGYPAMRFHRGTETLSTLKDGTVRYIYRTAENVNVENNILFPTDESTSELLKIFKPAVCGDSITSNVLCDQLPRNISRSGNLKILARDVKDTAGSRYKSIRDIVLNGSSTASADPLCLRIDEVQDSKTLVSCTNYPRDPMVLPPIPL